LAGILIFLAVYLVLALGRLPGFRVDRTGACIIGASLVPPQLEMERALNR
jgi:hypothetical protein